MNRSLKASAIPMLALAGTPAAQARSSSTRFNVLLTGQDVGGDHDGLNSNHAARLARAGLMSKTRKIAPPVLESSGAGGLEGRADARTCSGPASGPRLPRRTAMKFTPRPRASHGHPRNFAGRSSLCALAASVAMTAGASAAGIAVEQFIYPSGVPLPGHNGPSGWAGPWVGSSLMLITTPPPTGYPVLMLPPAGNAVQNTAVGECWRPLSAGGPVTNLATDVWVSWVEMSSAGGGGALVSLDPSGAGLSLYVNKDTLGNVVMTSGPLSTPALTSNGPGMWDLFVLRIAEYSGGLTTLQLWLNPTAPLTTILPASLVVPGSFSIGRYYWRSDAGQWLDEIRFGTAPTDVAAGQGSPPCYANCDGSTTSPALTVNDFICFQARFAAGDPYANCDGSTANPTLTVNDFICFQGLFAAGCP
jgi:hypothetical protein